MRALFVQRDKIHYLKPFSVHCLCAPIFCCPNNPHYATMLDLPLPFTSRYIIVLFLPYVPAVIHPYICIAAHKDLARPLVPLYLLKTITHLAHELAVNTLVINFYMIGVRVPAPHMPYGYMLCIYTRFPQLFLDFQIRSISFYILPSQTILLKNGYILSYQVMN